MPSSKRSSREPGESEACVRSIDRAPGTKHTSPPSPSPSHPSFALPRAQARYATPRCTSAGNLLAKGGRGRLFFYYKSALAPSCLTHEKQKPRQVCGFRDFSCSRGRSQFQDRRRHRRQFALLFRTFVRYVTILRRTKGGSAFANRRDFCFEGGRGTCRGGCFLSLRACKSRSITPTLRSLAIHR